MKSKETQQQTQDFDTQTSIEEINGNPVPVTVFAPVNNGDAANNVPLKDMSPKVGEGEMNMDEFYRMMRIHNERVNANQIVLSAEISAKEVIEGKMRVDKATQAPILDGMGQPIFYPDRYKVTLTFKGGTLVQTVGETMYNSLDLNSTYQFKGHLGFVKDFGQDVLSPIWQSTEKVM